MEQGTVQETLWDSLLRLLPEGLPEVIALSVAVGIGAVLLTEAIKTVWYSNRRKRHARDLPARNGGNSMTFQSAGYRIDESHHSRRVGKPIAFLANLVLSTPIVITQWEARQSLVVLIPILAWGVSTLFYRLILKALFVSADSALTRIKIRNAQTRNELAQASLELYQAEQLLAEAMYADRLRQVASTAGPQLGQPQPEQQEGNDGAS